MFTNQEVDRLEKDLRSADTQVKERTLRTIGSVAPDARAALLAVHNTSFSPLLLGSLFALDAGAALEAQSLERVAVETLAQALGGRSASRRNAARTALVHGNVSLAAVQPILERLARDRRATVRAAVGAVFIRGRPLETADISLVEEMLRDPWLRDVGATTAAHVLQRLLAAITSAVALPAGRSVAQRPPRVGRGRHVNALAQGLRALPSLGSSLVSALASRDPQVRVAAVRGLDALGTATSGATPALVRALDDRDVGVSNAAYQALRALKRTIDVDGTVLRAMLRSRRSHVRANALRCLPFARTTPPLDWETFVRALDSPAAEVQSAAAETLRQSFKEVPEAVLASLRRLAEAPSPHGRPDDRGPFRGTPRGGRRRRRREGDRVARRRPART